VDSTHSFDAPIRAVVIFIVIGVGAYLLLVRKKYALSAE
jgi:hypothetical protein